MGFLQAVYSLGERASAAYQDSPLSDIMSFLQLPYPVADIAEPEAKATKFKGGTVYAVRVWLEVADPEAPVLDVQGISRIDRIEYQAIGADEVQIKERCLYRDPVGSNVSWRFSPLYKLGKGSKEPQQELLGKAGTWEKDSKCRFYKLYHNLLKDYEISGCFAEGSAGRIMADLVAQIDRIAEFWTDKKDTGFLLFGLEADARFLYPGEVPVFTKYFREKLNANRSDNAAGKKKEQPIIYCSLCGEKVTRPETLDKVFKFATFDKPGFLPGAKGGTGVKEKVYPICETCYGVLSAGKEEMEKRFVNLDTLPGISLYVIPEIISDQQQYYRMASDFTRNFLKNGIKNETSLFKNLARHNEGLVYHFLFAETNQAQLIIHSLVEDVPPTHLRQLQELWEKTCTAFSYEENAGNNDKTRLDKAIKQIVAVLMSLAGKREQDKTVMRDKIIAIISKLLSDETIGIGEIKMLMVSRLAGLFTDPDWISPRGKEKMPGRLKMRGMAEVVDFLYRANGRG